MKLSGSIPVKRVVVSEGQLNITGSVQPIGRYKYVSSGGFICSGATVFNIANSYFYIPSGGMTIAGQVDTNWTALGYLEVTFSSTETMTVTPVYPVNPDQGIPSIVADRSTVTTVCAPAIAPNILVLNHNLDNASILKQFLNKNNLTLSENLNLVYNKFDNTWRFNQQWQDSAESWNLVIEWGCTNQIAGVPVE